MERKLAAAARARGFGEEEQDGKELLTTPARYSWTGSSASAPGGGALHVPGASRDVRRIAHAMLTVLQGCFWTTKRGFRAPQDFCSSLLYPYTLPDFLSSSVPEPSDAAPQRSRFLSEPLRFSRTSAGLLMQRDRPAAPCSALTPPGKPALPSHVQTPRSDRKI